MTLRQVAILNANYMSHRLKDHYKTLHKGKDGLVSCSPYPSTSSSSSFSSPSPPSSRWLTSSSST